VKLWVGGTKRVFVWRHITIRLVDDQNSIKNSIVKLTLPTSIVWDLLICNGVLLIAPSIAFALVRLANFLAMSWQQDVCYPPAGPRVPPAVGPCATLVLSGRSHVGLMNKLTCEPHREDEPLPWSYSSKAD